MSSVILTLSLWGILALLLLVVATTSTVSAAAAATLSKQELENLVHDLRGDDERRIVVWGASEHTAKQQNSGKCDSLKDALVQLTTTKDNLLKTLICEYAALCINDNRANGVLFSEIPKIYETLTALLKYPGDAPLATVATYLVYIVVFANAANHQGLIKAGAVKTLSQVLMQDDKNVPPLQQMWIAAALQNLAASYCDTKDDGRCYWDWPAADDDDDDEDDHKTSVPDHVVIEEDSLPILSDGSVARKEMIQNTKLIERVIKMACQGPVKGRLSPTNIHPGAETINFDEEAIQTSLHLVTWAATGLLKNLALEPSARPLLEPAMHCFCLMSHSNDWLEEDKGVGAIHHLRGEDPCWFDEYDEDDEDDPFFCVDRPFLDAEGSACDEYQDATAEECETKDVKGVAAKEACCGCDGGDNYGTRQELADEL